MGTERTLPPRWICFCGWRRRCNKVATYKILYWQEIPMQIKAEDDADDVTLMLDERFMQQIDILAAKRGLQAADDYLAQWKWSEEEEREGSAREVAEALKAELEAKGW
ncbi:MAG: virulence factor [Acidobacteriaceae bacterium]